MFQLFSIKIHLENYKHKISLPKQNNVLYSTARLVILLKDEFLQLFIKCCFYSHVHVPCLSMLRCFQLLDYNTRTLVLLM